LAIFLSTWSPWAQADEVLLTPAPRELKWTNDRLELGRQCEIVTEAAQQQVARVLAAELRRLHGVSARVVAKASGGPTITLCLDNTDVGKARLAKLSSQASWPPKRNPQEAYLLEINAREAVILAQTARGLLYGAQTLLQMVRPAGAGQGCHALGASIVDYPQLGFRSVHLCVFPNTELPAIRQAILVAARYKYNAVVIEPWASLTSRKRPETAYPHAYTPEQVRPLVQLVRSLGMEMIPMLNSWGHASGMRSRSSQHVVLDRFPQFRDLYEPDGWSFCLSNPAIYPHLFDRYGELLELSGPTRYFHVGMDEAWGHLGLTESKECRGDNPRKLIVDHLLKLHGYFAQRKIQTIMWHDMFIQRNHPTLGRLSPANSIPPIDSHLALDELPKDVVIAAWNYDTGQEWPVPKYFHEKGYPVVVCPWKSQRNTVSLLNTAKKLDLMGLMETTWDSLDVCLPSVGEAGVLAWTGPGYDLKQVPFDHWVAEIRKLPIGDLPQLESTLQAREE
jgi:hypothetical protein